MSLTLWVPALPSPWHSPRPATGSRASSSQPWTLLWSPKLTSSEQERLAVVRSRSPCASPEGTVAVLCHLVVICTVTPLGLGPPSLPSLTLLLPLWCYLALPPQ